MKANELKTLEVQELINKEKELKEELFNLKFQLSLGQLTNTTRVRQARRDIARIKTILGERELVNKEG